MNEWVYVKFCLPPPPNSLSLSLTNALDLGWPIGMVIAQFYAMHTPWEATPAESHVNLPSLVDVTSLRELTFPGSRLLMILEQGLLFYQFCS